MIGAQGHGQNRKIGISSTITKRKVEGNQLRKKVFVTSKADIVSLTCTSPKMKNYFG